MNKRSSFLFTVLVGLILFLPVEALSSEPRELVLRPAIKDPRAIFCLVVFILSYLFVMMEEQTRLRKSIPVMLGAGIIWAVIAYAAPEYNVDHEQLKHAIFHDLDEYGSLMLFLFAAMVYINALEATNVFATLRSWLVNKGFHYRQLFWVTGVIAFFLSAIADNLTTSLVMGSVILSVGVNHPRFVAISMVNIVCAANAGGAFSPFGDLATLMVWQSGHVDFFEFFVLFLPSLVTYAVPAIVMSFFIPADTPAKLEEHISMKRGGRRLRMWHWEQHQRYSTIFRSCSRF